MGSLRAARPRRAALFLPSLTDVIELLNYGRIEGWEITFLRAVSAYSITKHTCAVEGSVSRVRTPKYSQCNSDTKLPTD